MKTIEFTEDDKHNQEQLAELKELLQLENEDVTDIKNLQVTLSIAAGVAKLRISIGDIMEPDLEFTGQTNAELMHEQIHHEFAQGDGMIASMVFPLNSPIDVQNEIAHSVRLALEEEAPDEDVSMYD